MSVIRDPGKKSKKPNTGSFFFVETFLFFDTTFFNLFLFLFLFFFMEEAKIIVTPRCKEGSWTILNEKMKK